MKKFFVFIIIILLLCGINLNYVNNLSFENIFAGASVEVYVANQCESDYDCIANGVGMIIFCGINDLENIKSTYYINGFTIKINNKSVNDVLLSINPNYTFSYGGYYYGYTNVVGGGMVINERNVNFQCAENDKTILLGFPILLGSY